MARMPDFKGYVSDLGGRRPTCTAWRGATRTRAASAASPSCIHPRVCPNLDTDHTPLLGVYRAVDGLPGIKKSFIGSGVRYDLLLHDCADPRVAASHEAYTRELVTRHVSGG